MIVPNNPSSVPPVVPQVRPRLRRFSCAEYLRIVDLEILNERWRYELIDGRIVRMPQPSPPHVTARHKARQILEVVFGPNHYGRTDTPLDLSPVFVPGPDLVIVPGVPDNWATAAPTAAAARLVVEVSRSTLWIDRKRKLPLYAAAGVADLWIINPIDWQLEVYRQPQRLPGKRPRGVYRDQTILPLTATVTPLAAPQAVIAVASLFPPPPPPAP